MTGRNDVDKKYKTQQFSIQGDTQKGPGSKVNVEEKVQSLKKSELYCIDISENCPFLSELVKLTQKFLFFIQHSSD